MGAVVKNACADGAELEEVLLDGAGFHLAREGARMIVFSSSRSRWSTRAFGAGEAGRGRYRRVR